MVVKKRILSLTYYWYATGQFFELKKMILFLTCWYAARHFFEERRGFALGIAPFACPCKTRAHAHPVAHRSIRVSRTACEGDFRRSPPDYIHSQLECIYILYQNKKRKTCQIIYCTTLALQSIDLSVSKAVKTKKKKRKSTIKGKRDTSKFSQSIAFSLFSKQQEATINTKKRRLLLKKRVFLSSFSPLS